MLLSLLAERGALGSLPDPQHVWVCQPNALCHPHSLGPNSVRMATANGSQHFQVLHFPALVEKEVQK